MLYLQNSVGVNESPDTVKEKYEKGKNILLSFKSGIISVKVKFGFRDRQIT